MKKVNVVITRIENIVTIKILKQDKRTINKNKKTPIHLYHNGIQSYPEFEKILWQDETTGITIKTWEKPLLKENVIYLRGYDEEKDYNMAAITLDNERDAENYANKIKKTIQNYNTSKGESLQEDLIGEYNMFALIDVV